MRDFVRNRLRFSLRSALCMFLLAGIFFGWLGRHMREHRKEKTIVAEIYASASFTPSLMSRNGLLPVFL